MSTSPMTTVDRLRQAIAENLSIDAKGLQAAIGQLVVATSADYQDFESDRSAFYDTASGRMVLFADRIPEGREAQVVASEVKNWCGIDAAKALFGDRTEELLGEPSGVMTKTSELSGLAFDWAVAVSTGRIVSGSFIYRDRDGPGMHEITLNAPGSFSPSRDKSRLQRVEAQVGMPVFELLQAKFGDFVQVPSWVAKLHDEQRSIDQLVKAQRAGRPADARSVRDARSLLPSCDPTILKPLNGLHGVLQVRPISEADTYGLFFTGKDGTSCLAQHSNGYSCHNLAVRLVDVWSGKREPAYALEQFDYILRCGGLGMGRESIVHIAAGLLEASGGHDMKPDLPDSKNYESPSP